MTDIDKADATLTSAEEKTTTGKKTTPKKTAEKDSAKKVTRKPATKKSVEDKAETHEEQTSFELFAAEEVAMSMDLSATMELDKKAIEEAQQAQKEVGTELPVAPAVTFNIEELPEDTVQVEERQQSEIMAEEIPLSAVEAVQQADTKPEKKIFKKAEKNGPSWTDSEVWTKWLRPVVSLVAVCVVMALVVAGVYTVTEPLIAQNAVSEEDVMRAALLPAADGFEDISPEPLPANLLSVYQAKNGAGYVIEAFGNGYGGDVPVLVAIDTEGTVVGVHFAQNKETQGLGAAVYTDESFAAQFAGKPAKPVEQIDGIAGATLSSNAAMAAVNTAITYYTVNIIGGTLSYDVPEEVFAQLAPNVSSWETLDVTADNIAGAYLGDDGTYILVGQAQGEKTVTVVVALDDSGTVLSSWGDTSKETEGIGRDKGEDSEFMGQFVGQTSTDGIDTIAGATHTTGAIITATQAAIDALPLAKEAAGK